MDISELVKPRVAVFLPSPNEVQRFVLGRAFERIARHYRLIYVLPSVHAEKMKPLVLAACPQAEVLSLEISEKRFKSWSKLFRAGCFRYARVSRSFALRADIAFGGVDGAERLRKAAKKVARRLWLQTVPDDRLISLEKADLPLMLDKGVYARYRDKVLETLGPDSTVVALLESIDPLFVIMPSSLLDLFCNEVLWAADGRFATLLIQSGWDNLSSKGIIQHAPSFIGVWGGQSAGHAVDMQRLRPNQVIPLGSPHYEALRPVADAERRELRASLGVGEDQTLVLFGGSFRQFDETRALMRLDAMIDAERLPVKVLYRPHPYRLDRIEEDNFFEFDWRHIVFDAEMKDRYLRSKAEAGFIKREQPIYSMDYLARVLSSVDAVLSPMSTLLLEAMVMRKPTLALAYAEGNPGTYSAAAAAEMTHFAPIREAGDAVIWCADGADLETCVRRLIARIDDPSVGRAQRSLLEQIVLREPGTYANRLESACLDIVAVHALRKSDQDRERRASISHHYGADVVIQDYLRRSGVATTQSHIPGYWTHGWLPRHFNLHPGLVALHKKDGIAAADRVTDLVREKAVEPQWVGREDQADLLRRDGYGKVEAIGLPFAYLPDVEVRRQPGSLLVMPPHGRKEFYGDHPVATEYAEAIASMKGAFSDICLCLTERDFYRNEWRTPFQKHGIRIIIGSSQTEPNTQLRMKQLLSSFDYVTTNAFGSHIAYAAHCGAKVSIFGPFCEWNPQKRTHASGLFPELQPLIVDIQSEATMRREFPFLMKHPAEAGLHKDWGDAEIGLDCRRSPRELASLFGWTVVDPARPLEPIIG